MKFDYTIYSDGGASRGGKAAGACVVDGHLSGRRRGAVVFLGEGTNNEAEIAGALLGFSMVRLAAARRKEPGPIRVRWVADSEYTLKSGTEYIRNWQKNGWKTASKDPVKNQGLWRAYLALTSELEISPVHVRGHTGHPENELCDLAANWAKAEGEEALDAEQHRVKIPDGELGTWFLLDGREFLQGLREGANSESDLLELENQLSRIIASGGKEKEEESEQERSEDSAAVLAFTRHCKEAEALIEKFEKLGKTFPRAKKVAAKFKKALEE